MEVVFIMGSMFIFFGVMIIIFVSVFGAVRKGIDRDYSNYFPNGRANKYMDKIKELSKVDAKYKVSNNSISIGIKNKPLNNENKLWQAPVLQRQCSVYGDI